MASRSGDELMEREPFATSTALSSSTQRREAYRAGYLQAQAEIALLKREIERWKCETAWWRDESDRVHREFCDFVAHVAGEMGLRS